MKNLLLLFALLTIISCQDKQPVIPPESQDLISKYLNERVGQVIDVNEDIVLRFKEELDQSLFEASSQITFTPHIDGGFKWVDSYTLVFNPKERLRFDQNYSMSVDMEPIGASSTDDAAPLIINFKTRALHLSMNSVYQKLEAINLALKVRIVLLQAVQPLLRVRDLCLLLHDSL